MTVANDHGALAEHATRLVERLDQLRTSFVPGRIGYQQHGDFADRSMMLAHQLRAALLLSDEVYYAPAFVAVRTALEHHLVDRLLFLANRYLQVYPITRASIAAEDARLRGLQQGSRPDIRRWWVKDGRMNVLVWGVYLQGSLGRGQTLSPYYLVEDRYDPFTGRPRSQSRLAVTSPDLV